MNPHKTRFHKPDFTFITQNLRKLVFEDRVTLGAHVGTFIACFFPWASVASGYGPTNFINAFSGTTWLIGTIVFFLSLFSILLFADELFEKKILPTKIPRTILLGIASVQSLLLQLCAWSVLLSIENGNAVIEFRFGLAVCVSLQIMALVAVWLRSRSNKKEAVNEFFQLPTHGKSGESETNHHKK